MKPKITIAFFMCVFYPFTLLSWGFFAHKEINKLAIFTLPPEMIGFYKKHLEFIETQAVNPDKRRNVLKEEACRHFIDLDAYPDSVKLPMHWNEAVTRYSEDSLFKHGIVPWHIQYVTFQLTEAFRQKAIDKILRLSADLGHYAADANVPLHTTSNYNGQRTNQHGIHGFWESRLPELFIHKYDFFVGKAIYLQNVPQSAWQSVHEAHKGVDSVLLFEKELSLKFPEDKKYSFEERNGATIKIYSEDYSSMYHQHLGGQVERRMRASVLFVGSLWYTCWVNAGQPNLDELKESEISLSENEKQTSEKIIITKGDNCEH
ncbi:MAG TPA: zinc dependent phospholipase C family protein [Cytophagaceae bacterium]|jgi:hypothetical protein|nr:zinc dependent phospholipase C family protein [Cytophagaceae bacterium]